MKADKAIGDQDPDRKTWRTVNLIGMKTMPAYSHKKETPALDHSLFVARAPTKTILNAGRHEALGSCQI